MIPKELVNYNLLVEGNIASGKTTFIKDLSSFFETEKINSFCYSEEIVHYESLLQRFYHSPKVWSTCVQSLSYTYKMAQAMQAKELTHDFYIYDRSLIGDLVFIKTLYEQDKLSKVQYEKFKSILHHLLYEKKIYQYENSLVFYLYTPIDVCKKRMEKRGRESEKNVPIEYLKGIETSLEKVLKELPFQVFNTKEHSNIYDENGYIIPKVMIREIVNFINQNFLKMGR